MLSLKNFISDLPVFKIENLILPLGISYLTFKHISFLTDVYWGKTTRGKFTDFLCYSSLFTIFIAGPIERYERFLPQLNNSQLKFHFKYIDNGFERIVYGIFKKVLADWIGYFNNPIWQNLELQPLSLKILGLLGFSMEIYLDFAAYSDIAIGSSEFFGIKIMENFNNPYLKQNISQFWRSWHISLSDWLLDYIFKPLQFRFRNLRISGNVLAIIVTFIVCGIWHGPAWNFIIWGLWHGIGLSVFLLWTQYKQQNKKLGVISEKTWFNSLSSILNFSYVSIGWWWFR